MSVTKMRRSRFIAALLSVGLGAAMGPVFAQPGHKVGISMPTKSSQRWVVEGLAMMRLFTAAHYDAQLQFADDDVALQTKQIEAMIDGGAQALIIGAIDGTALAPTLARAAGKGVKIVSYDRLIRGTPNLDIYTTFDNFQVGVLQAQDIERRLQLKEGKGPFNVELFAGSLDDNNAFFFYNGAMSVLKPYMDKGMVHVASGQVAIELIATKRWNGQIAKARMNQLLAGPYLKKRVDAVLSPYDGMSMEILSALKSAGYGSTQPLPVVTGQDAELAAVRSIARGELASTVFKDTRDLAKVTVDIVDALLTGKTPKVNNTTTYDNGSKVVPSFLLKPVLVDKGNLMAQLVTSGYYTDTQVR